MKTTHLLILASAVLLSSSASAIIMLEYDNLSGDFTLSGSDVGPGIDVGSGIAWAYWWDFGSDPIAADVGQILTDIQAGTSGTVGATPFTNPLVTNANSTTTGWTMLPTSGGALTIANQTGTATVGLWNSGDGSFQGVPAFSSTTDNFAITVTSVPEPSSYAAIFGCLVLTLALTRRKVCSTL